HKKGCIAADPIHEHRNLSVPRSSSWPVPSQGNVQRLQDGGDRCFYSVGRLPTTCGAINGGGRDCTERNGWRRGLTARKRIERSRPGDRKRADGECAAKRARVCRPCVARAGSSEIESSGAASRLLHRCERPSQRL